MAEITSKLEQEGRELIGREIDSLRAEIASLRDRLAERAGDAASYVQSEASSVAGVIREHPATATTLFTLVGALGFAIGYAIGAQSGETKNTWYRRYY